MLLTKPDGNPINKWEDWTRPKMDYQWQPGRSAMELARAWFRNDQSPTVPNELIELFSSHERLAGLDFILGTPELVTPLPEKGEGRNHDLHFICKTHLERVTLCIEAKADEPFGNKTVAEYWSSAMKSRQNGIRTGVPERINKLHHMVSGKEFDPSQSPWANIRYQLLTAICGTVIQAKVDASTLGILIIHEFQTDNTKEENLARNTHDYEAFLQVVSGNPDKIVPIKNVIGPVIANDVDCLFGKVITTL